MLIQLISVLYAACAALLALFYVPQIAAAWRDREGARALSLWTWGFWSFSSIVSAAYAAWVVRDTAFVVATLTHLAGCLAVFVIAIWRRRHGLRAAP